MDWADGLGQTWVQAPGGVMLQAMDGCVPLKPGTQVGPAHLPLYNPFHPSLPWWRRHLTRFRRGGKKEGKKTVSFPLGEKKSVLEGSVGWVRTFCQLLACCPPPLTSPGTCEASGDGGPVVCLWSVGHSFKYTTQIGKKKGRKPPNTSYYAKINQKI